MTDHDFLEAALEMTTRIMSLVAENRKLIADTDRKMYDAHVAGDSELEGELTDRSNKLQQAGMGLLRAMRSYGQLVI